MSDERILEILENQDKYYILGFINGIRANAEELQKENEKLKADYGTKAQVERDLLLEENQQLKSELELYRNGVYYSSKIDKLEQENQQLKDNWDKIKDIIEDERMSHWRPSPLFLTELLSKMEELEEGKSE